MEQILRILFLILLTGQVSARLAYAHFETTSNYPVRVSKDGEFSYRAA